MAEYSARTGYDPTEPAGTDPADNIRSKEIKDLEKDFWTACWGPGKALSDMFSGTAAQKNEGLNQETDTGGLSMGTVSGNPASYNDATGVTASDPTDSTGGNQDFQRGDAHDATTSSVNRDHLRALQTRVNATMKRTGQSSAGVWANVAYIDEVTEHGALRGSSATQEVGRSDDLSRVRPDHMTDISTEIENLRSQHYPGKWTYMSWNTTSGGNSFNHIQNDMTRSTTALDWGEWNWTASGVWDPHNHAIPWSDSGQENYYRNYPFQEHGFRFADWEALRNFFNRGGKLWAKWTVESGSNVADAYNTWYAITGQGLFYGPLGVATTLEDITPSNTASINQIPTTGLYSDVTILDGVNNSPTTIHDLGGWDSTATCSRIYDIMSESNFCQYSGTPAQGGGASIGKCSDGTHSTREECNAASHSWDPLVVVNHDGNWSNVSPGDIITVDIHEGEVASVSGNEITLVRKMRTSIGQEVDHAANKKWCVSKWYRFLALRGDAGLYGGSQTEGSPEGYAFWDARIAYDTDPIVSEHIDVFIRTHLDNSMNEMTMENQNVEVSIGFMRTNSQGHFIGSGNPTGFKSYATAEDPNQGSGNWSSGVTAEKFRVGGIV